MTGSLFGQTHPNCEGCPILQKTLPRHCIIEDEYDDPCDILFVSDAPKMFEGEYVAFRAQEFKVIMQQLNKLELPDDVTVGFTYAAKCPSMNMDVMPAAARKKCYEHLANSIDHYKPTLVISCGALATNIFHRKVKDAGKARGPREGALQRRMNAEAARRRVAGPRKVRSNKGVARGPREGTLQRRMNAEAARRRAAGRRKVRFNKGVARGPREGTLQRRMNAEAARRRRVARKPRTGRLAAMRSTARKLTQLKTPTEAELYQMIFGTPPKRKVRANKGTKRGPRKTAAKKKSPLRMMLRSGRAKK